MLVIANDSSGLGEDGLGELLVEVLGGGEAGFELVAEGHQLIDLGKAVFLVGEGVAMTGNSVAQQKNCPPASGGLLSPNSCAYLYLLSSVSFALAQVCGVLISGRLGVGLMPMVL